MPTAKKEPHERVRGPRVVMNTDIYSLPGSEGELKFSYPGEMDEDTKDETKDWLELLKKKIDRVPGPQPRPPAPEPAATQPAPQPKGQ